MKWAIKVKAGKNYCEKHVYIPLRLSMDHVTCCCALKKYVHCHINWLNIPSPSSTATNLNHVTQ